MCSMFTIVCEIKTYLAGESGGEELESVEERESVLERESVFGGGTVGGEEVKFGAEVEATGSVP